MTVVPAALDNSYDDMAILPVIEPTSFRMIHGAELSFSVGSGTDV